MSGTGIGEDLLRFSDKRVIVFDGETQRLNLLQGNLPFEWAWIVAHRGKVNHSFLH